MTTLRNPRHLSFIPAGPFAVSILTVEELEAIAAHPLHADLAAHFEAIAEHAATEQDGKAKIGIFVPHHRGRIKVSGLILYTDKDRKEDPADYAAATWVQKAHAVRKRAEELGGSLTYCRGGGSYALTLPATFAGWRLLSEVCAPYSGTLHVDVSQRGTGRNVAERIPHSMNPQGRAKLIQELRARFVKLMVRVTRAAWEDREKAEAAAAEARATAERFRAVASRFRAMVEGAAVPAVDPREAEAAAILAAVNHYHGVRVTVRPGVCDPSDVEEGWAYVTTNTSYPDHVLVGWDSGVRTLSPARDLLRVKGEG